MAPAPGHTLPKRERISGQTSFARLVKGGRYGSEGCLKFCILEGNGLEFSRMAVSVPKRAFHRAVKRNLLKRRIRESYRLQKELLPPGVDILFIYISKEVLPLADISAAMGKILSSIGRKSNEQSR